MPPAESSRPSATGCSCQSPRVCPPWINRCLRACHNRHGAWATDIYPAHPVRQPQLYGKAAAQLQPRPQTSKASASSTAHSATSTSAPAVSPVTPPRRATKARRSSQKLASAATSASRPLQPRSEEHTSELQSRENLVCRLPLENKNSATRRT